MAKKEGCGLGSYLLERKRWSGGHILVDQTKKGGKRKGWEYRFLSGSREIVASMDAGSGQSALNLKGYGGVTISSKRHAVHCADV